MSFLSFMRDMVLFEWLFGKHRQRGQGSAPPPYIPTDDSSGSETESSLPDMDYSHKSRGGEYNDSQSYYEDVQQDYYDERQDGYADDYDDFDDDF